MQRQQTSSICASYSDFCSLGERSQGNREQLLTKENARLRKQHSEISAKYMGMCNQLSKMQSRLVEKQRKMVELDLFYKHQIEEIKKELSSKTHQISKLSKGRARNCSLDKQNRVDMANNQNLSMCMQNQSALLNQNVRLKHLIEEVTEVCSPVLNLRENSEIARRISAIRRQFQQKTSMNAIIQRSNCMIQELRTKGADQLDGSLGSLLTVIRNKSAQLKKTPLSFDYDIETQTKNLEVLLTDIDIQMRLIQPLRPPNSHER